MRKWVLLVLVLLYACPQMAKADIVDIGSITIHVTGTVSNGEASATIANDTSVSMIVSDIYWVNEFDVSSDFGIPLTIQPNSSYAYGVMLEANLYNQAFSFSGSLGSDTFDVGS